MKIFQLYIFIVIFCSPLTFFGQDIQLLQQFNGRYDYTAIGNTLNLFENGSFAPCSILTSSSADLALDPNQNVIAAYLYWAGSGFGDFDILVNDIPVSAERTFSDALDGNRVFFAAFADITVLVQNEGNTTYTISEFDLTNVIAPYCPTGTNFGGWAITIIYEDGNLPLNQLNVYDGLQSVPTNLTIVLENLNVLDNEGAKIGFVAWEGDAALAVNEQLSINGNVIGNPPLNPINNAFNGTNSFTGASNLYNMDIDFYDIQNNITIGDTSATIELTSGQDFVMINNVITVLNSQLPDATINLDDFIIDCERQLQLDYTVYNTNSTDILPANTPIAFYADTILIGQSATINALDIDESESNSILLTVPDYLTDNFELKIIVDDNGNQNGVVTETDETNNGYIEIIDLFPIPMPQMLPETVQCNEGFDSAIFNLIDVFNALLETSETMTFYTNLSDLEANQNEIFSPEAFSNTSNPQSIYVKLTSDPCYEIYQFNIAVRNCPPHVPSGFSPNGDGYNDWFNIQGLYDIFLNHQLKIFNRYGELIFEGDNSIPWEGRSNRGLNNLGNLLPVGTYFYILNLNDSDYKPISGWVYLNY